MAIQTEVLSERHIRSYSDNNKKIKPVFDRLGKPIREDAVYDGKADDIIVDGKPRYDYVETDEDVEIIEETEQEQC